jgi:hypothetical protein
VNIYQQRARELAALFGGNGLSQNTQVTLVAFRLQQYEENLRSHADALAFALQDALSTFRADDTTVIVTAERQEAWTDALSHYQESKKCS